MKRAISLCLAALIIALSIGGCASGMKNEAASYSPQAVPANSGAPPQSSASGAPAPRPESADAAPSAAEQWTPNAEGGTGSIPILTPSNPRGVRYIYTIDLQLQTTGFMAGIRTLLSNLGDMDGYVESEHLHGRDLHAPPRERSAEYSLRLYTERLMDFLMMIEDNFNIVDRQLKSENITGRYVYGESAIDDLREQEARLLTALNNTRLETSDRLDLEQQLSQVQYSIRNYEKEQGGFDDGIFYSTINIQLFEVIFPDEVEEEEEEQVEEAVPEPTFAEKLNQAVTRSANGFLAFCQGVVIVIIRILPTIVVLAVIAVIALLIIRAVKKHRKSHGAHHPPNNE